jgi:hypothetical protein
MRNGGTPPAHFDKAERAKAFDNEWLRLKEEALIRIDAEHRGLRPPFVATNITDFLRSVEATDARNRQALEALDARNRQALEALETRHRQALALEAYIVYDAPALPTTTSPELPAMLFPSPRPTSPYLGAVLNTTGGGICRCIRRRLQWRFQHHFPSSKRCWLRGYPPTTMSRMATRGPCLLRLCPPR